MLTDRFYQQFVYWGVWILIPFLWEILIGIISSIFVAAKWFKKKEKDLDHFPVVTILVPVYNSESTLYACLNSILCQTYPSEKIEVYLVDNGSKDNSYVIFEKFQAAFPKLRVWWISSSQGKAKALNKGVFGSNGKYVINIDSDGWLDCDAIKNIVTRFENNDKISCMTGVILTDPELIKNTDNSVLKLIRICELFEYNESFLIGRHFESIFNNLYTLAGAFSCFRREVLLKTQLYNCETIGEDAHMTFQVRNFVGGRVEMCENAFFYVDPIENINKLYTQRQRWQRAQLEVASLFSRNHLGNLIDFFLRSASRKILSDHTLAFPRLIWIFAIIYLYFINYPLKLIIGSNLLIYLLYVVNSFFYMLVSFLYLRKKNNIKSYLYNHWYICFLLPVYRFLVYWMRMAGIINSMTTESKWRTQSFSEEIQFIRQYFKQNILSKFIIFNKLNKFINDEDKRGKN